MTNVDDASNLSNIHRRIGAKSSLVATLYPKKNSKCSEGFQFADVDDDLIAFLKEYSKHNIINAKGDTYVIGPAVTNGKSKSRKSDIVCLNSIWMDFDGGDMKPKDVAAMFPEYQCVIYSTFNSTKDKPRFRVIFPLSCNITAKVYHVIWKMLEQQIKSCGYVVKQNKWNKEQKQSGLDRSSENPTQLYYLPCRNAANLKEAFFYGFVDDRTLIDPERWIKIGSLSR